MTKSAADRLPRVGALAALALVLGLQAAAVAKQSLVGDAAYHLLAGHQALRYGENVLNLEHPPLVKLVAALPLLAEAPLAPPITVDRVLETSLAVFDDHARLQRVRIAARVLVLAAFGLPLLAVCYLLGRQVGGRRTGVVLALVCGLSIPILPNLSILQTDAAVALGFTLTVLAALRYQAAPSLAGAALLGIGLGLAVAAKHSGLLALPTAVLAFVLARGARRWGLVRDLAVAALVAIGLVGATYAVANRHYDPRAGRDAIVRYCRGEALIVGDRMKLYEEPLLAAERISPGLAQWATGLLGIRLQNEIGVYPTYAFGTVSSRGRWWYFPAVLLVKTPLAVIAAALAFFVGWARTAERLPERRRRGVPPLLILSAAAAVYLGVAMASSYNLGVRHLLPVLPVLYLPAASWAARRRWRAAAVVGLLAAESLALAPLWMSATNTWWLGRYNPTRFALSAGDAEYHQNFIALADAARRRGIERLHVVYPLVSEREIRAYLPRAAVAGPAAAAEGGEWYAVNMTLEQYLPAIRRARPEDVRSYASLAALAETWEPLWRQIVARGDDHGWVAATFHLYRIRE